MIAARKTAAVGSETTQIVSNTYAGGLSGGQMRLWLELPNGAVQRLNSKGSFRVPAGARLVMEAPGSGLGGIPAQVPKVRRLAAGGRWIRTIGTPEREACTRVGPRVRIRFAPAGSPLRTWRSPTDRSGRSRS